MEIPLTETGSVTLNGSGNGTVQMGPARSRDTWRIDSVSVSCSSAVKEAQANVYAGHAILRGTYVGGTYMGSSGDTTDTVNKIIRAGESLFVVFTNGVAGAIATVNVYGTKVIR